MSWLKLVNYEVPMGSQMGFIQKIPEKLYGDIALFPHIKVHGEVEKRTRLVVWSLYLKFNRKTQIGKFPNTKLHNTHLNSTDDEVRNIKKFKIIFN